jgi:hypothetical protein
MWPFTDPRERIKPVVAEMATLTGSAKTWPAMEPEETIAVLRSANGC